MWSADGLRLEKMISGIEHLAGLTDPVNNKVTALVRKDGRDVAVTLDVATMKLLQQTTLPALPK
jgi:gamma-glutamyl phosphate reductase